MTSWWDLTNRSTTTTRVGAKKECREKKTPDAFKSGVRVAKTLDAFKSSAYVATRSVMCTCLHHARGLSCVSTSRH